MMKRVFPLIILLIALSVVGILFIQTQWIQNAVLVKKEQYEQYRRNATKAIQESMNDLFLQKYSLETGMVDVTEISKQRTLALHFTVEAFSDEEVQHIIQKALRRNNIKSPFDYNITNIFGYSIKASKSMPAAQSEGVITVTLTSPNATHSEVLYLILRESNNYIVNSMGWMILASILLTTIIISAFALTVRTLFNQKKVSEIKSDFINNMTHELKTPLATISLAVDALTNKKVINNEDQIRYYSAMIREENKRMNKQVETILQAARIERQETTLTLERVDAHKLIHDASENLILQIQEKQGSLTLNLKAPKHFIMADEMHFSNIINNLLDNALKYSREGVPPVIVIETVNNGSNLAIRIRDNGIGMNKETQSRVFEKFYRAHTGNLHNVKGFGLGLSYVKAMVDAHHGRIKLDSTLGKGSVFIVSIAVA